jgi:hypothetical protein
LSTGGFIDISQACEENLRWGLFVGEVYEKDGKIWVRRTWYKMGGSNEEHDYEERVDDYGDW